MFSALDRKVPSMRKPADKLRWFDSFEQLAKLRKTGTIGDVLRHLAERRLPPLPESVERRWKAFERIRDDAEAQESPDSRILRKLEVLPYREVSALARYFENNSPFDTQHGVKGAEFDNVIVILGRGWNQYDFNSMLEWYSDGVPAGKEGAFERARNLFYVACSRPRTRLAAVFTQELSAKAQKTVASWIGQERILPLMADMSAGSRE